MNLNEFYLKYSPDKYADQLVKLKRPKAFHDHQEQIFQVENLVRIYNIFSSSTVDIEVKKSAGEQLAIMLTDSRLHKAFINLGGIQLSFDTLRNYSQNISNESDVVLSICSSCLTWLSNVFYWNKDVRTAFLFDIKFYKLIFRCKLIKKYF